MTVNLANDSAEWSYAPNCNPHVPEDAFVRSMKSRRHLPGRLIVRGSEAGSKYPSCRRRKIRPAHAYIATPIRCKFNGRSRRPPEVALLRIDVRVGSATGYLGIQAGSLWKVGRFQMFGFGEESSPSTAFRRRSGFRSPSAARLRTIAASS